MLVQALHPIFRPHRGQRLGHRSGGACQAHRLVVGIDAWQAPILADTARPDWYKGALFNELYFLVDGGTVWTDGEPRRPSDQGNGSGNLPGPGPAVGGESAESLGHFAVLECYDYPFYNTLDVNFYASWALLLLWPDLDVGVVRDFAATVDLDDPEIVTVGWQGTLAQRKRRGAMPHDLGAPNEDPFLRPNAYHWRDINIWKDLNSKFVLQVWRTSSSCRLRSSLTTHGRRSSRRWTISAATTATATGCRSTTASLTRPTTCGR